MYRHIATAQTNDGGSFGFDCVSTYGEAFTRTYVESLNDINSIIVAYNLPANVAQGYAKVVFMRGSGTSLTIVRLYYDSTANDGTLFIKQQTGIRLNQMGDGSLTFNDTVIEL